VKSKLLVIVLSMLSGACALKHSPISYTPTGCDAMPDKCRICPPGMEWKRELPGPWKCRPRPVVTPSPEPTRPPVVSETPTPAPTATPTASPSPTVPVPTSTPTAPPAPTPTPFCVSRASVDPITVAYKGGCPRGLEPFHHEPEIRPDGVIPPGFTHLCGFPGRVAWLLGNGTWKNPTQFQIVQHPSGAYVQQEINGNRFVCIDASGQTFWHCEAPYPFGTREDAWSTGSYPVPPFCEDQPPPVVDPPAPTAPGPAPSGTRENFSLAFTNASDKCRNFHAKDDTWAECEPDGAHRFRATLQPQGKNVQNTCDWDHQFCAVEPCVQPPDKNDDEWAKVLQDHRDTYQMCGGDEWITPAGIRHEWRYVSDRGTTYIADRNSSGPYQGSFIAIRGAWVEARGCMPEGAYACPAWSRKPEEFDCPAEARRPIPGAGQCGPWKLYQVP
jgi:hypothetical protein